MFPGVQVAINTVNSQMLHAVRFYLFSDDSSFFSEIRDARQGVPYTQATLRVSEERAFSVFGESLVL